MLGPRFWRGSCLMFHYNRQGDGKGQFRLSPEMFDSSLVEARSLHDRKGVLCIISVFI